MLSCTAEFDATVAFYRDVLGLAVAEPDVATVDTHFSRYACAVLPTGGTLEVVEPAPAAGRLHGQQILCFKVDGLLATRGRTGTARGDVRKRRVRQRCGPGLDLRPGAGREYLPGLRSVANERQRLIPHPLGRRRATPACRIVRSAPDAI